MRVFLCEFVTGGGLAEGRLPASLVREGAMMRNALTRDLLDVPGVELVSTHDARVAPIARGASRAIWRGDDPWAAWAELAASCAVAWPIAPETGGVLARLVAICRGTGTETVAPDVAAIRTAASKRATAERLKAEGVATPDVWSIGDPAPAGRSGPFVVKPDDGAGCEDTRVLERWPTPGDAPMGSIVQPFIEGEPASLIVLARDEGPRVLAANRQRIHRRSDRLEFRGVSVGSIEVTPPLVALAEGLCAALPGLRGLVGIDVVLTPDGPVAIEVNPRLTTSYCGLREAIGINPATLVPPFAREPAETMPPPRVVDVAV